ncbi:hypothetical protein ACHAXR_006127 [Thalassiosira sp. AJA248-18]
MPLNSRSIKNVSISIGLVPSGRIAVAGFTDGTLRLFDLTGIFAKDKNHPENAHHHHHPHGKKKESITGDSGESLFDDDSSSDEEEDTFTSNNCPTTSTSTTNAKSMSVNSHSNQRYGAVACQIHARGVHTSLLMDVAVSEDGLYAFGGVQRGSVELAAVYLGDVEGYLDERQEKVEADRRKKKKKGEQKEEGNDDANNNMTGGAETPGLLDLIQVDRHADAKLKGFGACTRLWNGWDRARNGVERPEYLLFTGKGIKNIHIWSYKPSRLEKGEESVWTCLYDTPGNGTSINQLYFRHNGIGTLQAISKSDDQKLRVWDLTYEQQRVATGGDGSDRPKRPDYVDVASTEGTIGVCGPYAFASGSLGGMHNIINVVGLDADDASSPYNCTELALPLVDAAGGGGEGQFVSTARPSRTGRQQRGDLKSVVHVSGLVFDASHALLQLSDGSVVHYLHDQSGHPLLLQSPPSLCTTCIDDDSTSFGAPQHGGGPSQNKRMSLARVGSQGMVLFAVSSFNENTSRGAMKIRALPGSASDANASKGRRYWGFNGLKKKRKQATSKTLRISPAESAVGVVRTVESTPLPATKGSKKANSIEKVAASVDLDLLPVAEPAAKKDGPSCPSKKHEGNELEQMVSQVESTPAPVTKKTSEPTTKTDKASRTSKKRSSEDAVDCTPIPMTQGNQHTNTVRKVTPGDLSPAASEPTTAQADKSSHPNKKRPSAKLEQMDSQLESIAQVYNQETMHSPKRSNDERPTSGNDLPTKKQKTSQGKQDEADPKPESVEKPLPSSPKRRGRKKATSPKKSLPAKDDTSELQADPEYNNRTVGFLGMTILDSKVKKDLPESCYQPKDRPRLLVEQLPSSTIKSRLANTPAIQTSLSTEVPPTECAHFRRHCEERQTLAAKHRAEHEMLRKKVLHSIRYVLSTWDIELNSTKSYTSIVDSAKKWFDEALVDHQEMLDDMLDRQVLEAESLAARQTSELPDKRAPMLQVSFSFPEVFEQARQEMISILN